MGLRPNIRLAGLAFLLWATAYNVTAPLLPIFAADLGASPVQVGLIAAAAGAGAVVLVLPLAYVSDRVGRKAAMITGWALSTVGVLLMAAAPSWAALLPGAFCSLGVVAALPTLNTMIVEESAPGDRVRTFALLYGAGPLGLLLGAPAGGLIADAFGLRTGVVVAGLLSAGAVAVTLFLSPTEVEPPASSIAPTHRRGRTHLILSVLAAATALGMLFVSLPGNFIAPYLHDVRGQSLISTSLYTSGLAAAQLVWSLLFSVWPKDSGQAKLGFGPIALTVPRAILIALATSLAANALFGVLLPQSVPGLWTLALFLRGSQYALQGLGSALMGEVVPSGPHLTTRLTLVSAAAGIGVAGGPLVGGWLYQMDQSYPFWVSGAAAATGAALLAALVHWPRKEA